MPSEMQCELIFFDFYIFKNSGSDVQLKKKKKESFICSLIISEMSGVV